MEFKLPEEAWSGKEVKFSHLKVLGCVSYIHIDFVARRKLDSKSKICFFSLAMVVRNLAIGFGMNKTKKSSKVEM